MVNFSAISLNFKMNVFFRFVQLCKKYTKPTPPLESLRAPKTFITICFQLIVCGRVVKD